MKWKMYLLTLLLIFAIAGCESKPQNLPDDKVNNEQPSKEPDAEPITSTPEPTVEQKQIITAPVHFMNFTTGSTSPSDQRFQRGYVHTPDFLTLSYEYDKTFSQVVSHYNADIESEELYAFIVEVGNRGNAKPYGYPELQDGETYVELACREQKYLVEKIDELLEGTNLYLMKDYPYTLRQALYAGPWALYSEEEGKYIKPDAEIYGPGVCVVGRIKDFVSLCENGKAVNGWYCRFISAVRPDVVEVMNEAVEKQIATYRDELWGFHSEYYGLTPHREYTEVTVTVDLIK